MGAAASNFKDDKPLRVRTKSALARGGALHKADPLELREVGFEYVEKGESTTFLKIALPPRRGHHSFIYEKLQPRRGESAIF